MIVYNEPELVYNRLRFCHITAHTLIDFLQMSAERFLQSLQAPKADTAAFRFGRAFHTCVLFGEASMRSEFPCGLSPADMELIVKMAIKARQQLSESFCPEVVVRRTLSIDGRPLQIQGRIDAVGQTTLYELKTISDLRLWDIQWRKYGYDIQAAFYSWLYYMETGVTLPISVIAVEKRLPCNFRLSQAPAFTQELFPYSALVQLADFLDKNNLLSRFGGVPNVSQEYST